MTRQEMFDKAYLGLAAQGFKPSMKGEYGDCAYRGVDDMKCAIGHLVDDKTAGRMECYGPIENCFRNEVEMPFDKADEEFMARLQLAHDESTFAENRGKMQEMLVKFAAHFNLTVPEV